LLSTVSKKIIGFFGIVVVKRSAFRYDASVPLLFSSGGFMKKIVMLLPLAAFLATGAVYAQSGEELTVKYKCGTCHKLDKKTIGPAYQEIAKKYAGDAAAPAQMAERIKKGSRGVWGPAPMTPQANASDEDIKAMIDYIMSLKK
jgi:cytochrome c